MTTPTVTFRCPPGFYRQAFTMSVYAHSQDDALKAAASSFGRVVTIRDTETGSDG
jgi:integrase